MPKYLAPNTLSELNKVAWRLDLVWLSIPPINGADRDVFLTDHFHNIEISPKDLEPSIDRVGNYVFIATSGLMSVGTITDDLEAKDAPLNITLNGIRRDFTATVLDNNIKGSRVSLYRAFFNQDTGAVIGRPIKRWVGRIDAVNIQDDTNIESKEQGVITIGIDCRSIISLIKAKQSGLYTSESSWQSAYPNDTSMHNIAGLVDRQFNFGKEG